MIVQRLFFFLRIQQTWQPNTELAEGYHSHPSEALVIKTLCFIKSPNCVEVLVYMLRVNQTGSILGYIILIEYSRCLK